MSDAELSDNKSQAKLNLLTGKVHTLQMNYDMYFKHFEDSVFYLRQQREIDKQLKEQIKFLERRLKLSEEANIIFINNYRKASKEIKKLKTWKNKKWTPLKKWIKARVKNG